MAHVIDLSRRSEEEKEIKKEVPEIKPVAEPVIKHPIAAQDKVFAEKGGSMDFRSLTWEAPSAYRREGIIIPYIFAGLLILGSVYFAVFRGEAISAILFGLMGIMVVVASRRKMHLVKITINPIGIFAEDKVYKFSDIKSFWVDYEPEYDIRELSLHLKHWAYPLVKIQLGEQDPVQVHLLLIEFIPEEHHEYTFAHTLVRWLGI